MNLPKFEYQEWFRLVDKATWATKGEWHKEADRVQWLHEASGYPCVITRNPNSGGWCGYVGIPESNKAYESDYDNVDDLLEEDVYVEAHGGLTFASDRIYEQDEQVFGDVQLWWFGFDCAHVGDISPELDAMLRGVGHEPIRFSEDVYRTQEYVIAETNSLAEQLAKFEKEIES